MEVCLRCVCFSPTLYVGKHLQGLYALPSLVDKTLVTIRSTDSGPLLLDGPDQNGVVYEGVAEADNIPQGVCLNCNEVRFGFSF